MNFHVGQLLVKGPAMGTCWIEMNRPKYCNCMSDLIANLNKFRAQCPVVTYILDLLTQVFPGGHGLCSS